MLWFSHMLSPAIGRWQDKQTVAPCAEKWSDYERLHMSTGDHAHVDLSVTTMMNRLIRESLGGSLDMLQGVKILAIHVA